MGKKEISYIKLYDEIINPIICNQFRGLCKKLGAKDKMFCKSSNHKNCGFYQKMNQISEDVKIQQQIKKYTNLINQTIIKTSKYSFQGQ